MANDLPDHVRRNREVWNRWAADYAEPGRANWSRAEPGWGIWDVPESAVGVLPAVDGRDTVELGCGTGYVSAWLARRGGRPVGVDLSSGQLATARALQREFGLHFPLVQASAEAVPLAGERFDLVISEYGACLWADPYRWIPEAARLLRPGGDLVFLTNAFLLMLCLPDEENAPATDRLLRDAFGMHRMEWTGSPEVTFHLPHGKWIELLRASGFEVEALIELRPAEDATSRFPFVRLDWARRWPCEEIWKARRRG
jgi:SAM-dependent methyltransferase